MVANEKKIAQRMYLFAFVIFVMALAVVVKMTNIQVYEGEKYRKLAAKNTIKRFVIPANKGNIYSVDGSLLATSIPNYDIRFDALAPKQEDFDANVGALANELSKMLGKSPEHYENLLTRARDRKNRYLLIAKGLSYTEYMRLKSFPLFDKGAYKGGIIVDQRTVREYPIGKIALRTIGYDRIGGDGKRISKGIEAAFGNYLNGKDGQILKQKIAKGQWKPIRDENEIDPRDGYDVISTIDVFIQDIAHHALLKQLQEYKADHGCVVVMETKTGEIRAISNLGRAKDSTYYETINYAVAESHEPGSTFKLLDLIALLDDKRADTSDVYDRNGGVIRYSGKEVRDSHYSGAEPKVSLARGFEISSNTVMVKAVYDHYKKDPKTFVDRINRYGLNKPLGLPFDGEGQPVIPQPGEKRWSAISLPWMAFGYGVSVTPLQTLTLYNAVANDGEMVKPLFVREIKEWNRTVKTFGKEVIHPKIASDETLAKVRAVMANVVRKGTGKPLYSPNFSMAGKTGTAQVDYHKGKGNLYYASSFVGYFPADNPKYSCIVVVHKPSTAKGYYGADVAGPVFKRIAQKIFTDSPSMNEVKNLKKLRNPQQDRDFERYENHVASHRKTIPNLKGMPGMDAVALLENLGLKVRLVGSGKVKKQSLEPGESIGKNTTITLELS